METAVLLIIIGLLFSLAFNSKSFYGRRRGWIAKTYLRAYSLIGLATCYLNIWIGLFILLLVYHLYKNIHGEKDVYILYTNEFLMYVGLYFAVNNLIKEWMIIYILSSIVIIGIIISCVIYYVSNYKYKLSSTLLHLGPWEIYEGTTSNPNGGLGNINITQIFISICIAIISGWVLEGYYWTVIGLLVLWYPLYKSRDNTKSWKQTGLEQGILYIGIILCTIIMLFNIWTGLLLSCLSFIGIFYIFDDSGRLNIWKKLLKGWLVGSLKNKIFGLGVNSFRQKAISLRCEWSNAHNEYIQVLIEYGIIGLLLLVGFIGTNLFKIYIIKNYSLLFALIVLCSSAMIYFPWKAYKEEFMQQGNIKIGYGSQLLLILSIILIACV